jgi:predicted GNAT family N-acyltransferase
VVDFYSKYGFEKQGEMFEEAGIKHYKMVLHK